MTDERRELEQTADQVLSKLSKAPAGRDGNGLPGAWRTLVDLGWTLVGIPEGQGGSGGTFRELTVLAMAVGRHALSVPLVNAATAAWVLCQAGHSIAGDGLSVIVVPTRGDVSLGTDRASTGAARAAFARSIRADLDDVPWGRAARRLMMFPPNAPTPVLLDLDDQAVKVEPRENLAGEPRDRIILKNAFGAVMPEAPELDAVRARLGLLWAAQVIGCAQGAFTLTSHHVSTREQFGRPLIRIPAVASHVAEMHAHLRGGLAGLEGAIATHSRTSASAAQRLAASASARVLAAQTATFIAGTAQQLHGAMGVTMEHPLSRLSRRLLTWRDEGGSEQAWALWLAASVEQMGEEGVWDGLAFSSQP
jgi:acyl-CoA dehydrogenase